MTGQDLVAVTELKKKGQRTITLEGGHMLLYTRVIQEQKLYFLINRFNKEGNKIGQHIRKIIMVELDIEDRTNTRIVIADASNDDDYVIKKDDFWGELTGISENLNGRILFF